MEYKKSGPEIVGDLSKLEELLSSSTGINYKPKGGVYTSNSDCSCPECDCLVEALSPAGVAAGIAALVGFAPLK